MKHSKMQTVLPALGIVIVAAVMRIIPHVPNIAPIAAMALFGGMYLNKRYALVVPLGALLVSDLLLGFYKGMPFVYGSFLLTGLLGLWLQQRRRRPITIIGGTLLSSVVFFLISNFGVWLQSGMYAHSWVGFIRCYTLALPFFRNTIIGDLLYMGLFVVSYEAVILLLHPTRLMRIRKA